MDDFGNGRDRLVSPCLGSMLADAAITARIALAVFDFTGGCYNPHRRHTSTGNISPAEYERRSQVA